MLAGMRIPAGVIYSVIAHPTDGSVWGAVPGPMPGRIIRIDPKTCVSEVYEPPFNNPAVNVNGYTPRGIDVDCYGVIWTALAGSGHLASFDRRKCRVLTGPGGDERRSTAPKGGRCIARRARASRARRDAIPVDMHYYNFVDRFNTLGLGPNVPLANGTNSDSLLALLPDGRWVVLRVPYPLGFFSRGMDGRIDDPNGGWKGRGALCRLRPERRVAHRGRQGHAQLASSSSSCGPIRWPSDRMSSAHRACCDRRRVALRSLRAARRARRRRDLAGMWGQRFHEDLPERGAGPEIGDYTGLPVNDAARLRADSWDAAKWTMPERQCEPHPADYGAARSGEHCASAAPSTRSRRT